MATKRWRGDAPAVPQVDTLTVGGTIEVGDIFIVTINGKSVTVVAASTVVATVATAIYTALAASTIPEFAEITWANPSGGVISATGPDDGAPITITATTTETGGGGADSQTFVQATTTSPSGPNWWSVAANWSDAAVPVDSDEIDLVDSEVDILYGLAQTSVTLARLTRHKTFTGKVGLPDYNETGSEAYYEYRQKALHLDGVTRLDIDESSAGRFRINLDDVQSAVVIYGTGAGVDGVGAVQIDGGTHASNTCQVIKGSVDIAMGSGQTVTLASLLIGYESQQDTDAVVRCGSGCTLTAITKAGGELHTYGAVVAGTQYAGAWHHYDGAFTGPTFAGGTVYYMANDALTSPVLSGDAVLDFTRDLRAREVVSCEAHDRAEISDPWKTVTWTNGIDLVRRGMEGIDLGQHINLARAAV